MDDTAHTGHGAGALPGGAVLGRMEAEPVHAGVQLELDRQRTPGTRAFQHAQLFVAVDRGGQPVLLDQGDVLRLEKAFQQQDGALPAQVAQQHGFVQVQQAEAVGAAQRGKDAADAVAVGIGLDHGPDARVRRAAADDVQVIGQRGLVDDGVDGSWHGVTSRESGSALSGSARRSCAAVVPRARYARYRGNWKDGSVSLSRAQASPVSG
ncbi:hypothetical protein D9M72_544700 [compost metagenome]